MIMHPLLSDMILLPPLQSATNKGIKIMKHLIMVSLVALLSIPSLALARSSSPVTLEYNVPEKIEPGDQVTTTIRLIANRDLPKLMVTASPYSGLLLLSGGDNIEFTGLNQGDSREINVTIQLDSELGYLTMQIATTDAMNRERHNNISIRYGAANEATRARMKSPHLSEDSTGEKLILMPAE